MSHRRLLSLAVVASLLLLLGLYVRTRLPQTNASAHAAPPSEATALQQLSHEGLLRRASNFVSERTADVARHVVYVPESAASGVRWRADTVLSAGLHRPIDISTTAAADSGRLVIREVAAGATRNEWLLVVGRARNGAILSVAGSIAGRVGTRCDTSDIDEFVLNVPLDDHFAGAGLFDIDGALVGMVVRCGDRSAAIPAGQIRALLAQREAPAPTAEALGASLASLDSVGHAYFQIDTGAVVTAVRRGSAAQAIGLRPGDVVLSIDGTPMSAASDVARALATRAETTHRIVRLRGRARSTLSVSSRDTLRGATTTQFAGGLGIELFTEPRSRGVPITGVQPGSAAHAAGLQVGDRLTRIGAIDVATRTDAERLLRIAPPGLIFIAFDRDSVEYGALVHR